MSSIKCTIFLIGICFVAVSNCFTEREFKDTRNEIKEMFFHGYNNYMQHAYPHDELKPITCGPRIRKNENRGHIDDCLGNFSLTLVDSLDTLVVMGEIEEFRKGANLLKQTLSFDTDVTVSLFETTIRVLGGLLSIHLLAEQHIPEYQGEFLVFAEDLGKRLLPAFNTPTGIPWSRINLKRGVMPDETLETCTAGAGTLLIEFGTLSRLTNNHTYEEKAFKAIQKLWHYRSHLNLLGNVINIASGKWIQTKSGIGAGADSFYEYLLKSYILFGTEELWEMFNKSYTAIEKHNKRGGWYLEVNMHSGELATDHIDSLQAFWPAIQVLSGDIKRAIETHEKLQSVSKIFGFLPEMYSIKSSSLMSYGVNYPLRPESTKNDFYLNLGKEMIHKLQTHTRVSCGFASISNVMTKTKEDRMDSFFLSETLKYLYLLFDPENEFNKKEYIYSTEGHPFPINKLIQKDGLGSKLAVDDECFCDNLEEEHLFDTFNTLQPLSTHQPEVCLQQSNPIQIEIVNKPVGLPMVAIVPTKQIEGYPKLFGTPASFGPAFTTKGLKGELMLATPNDGCSTITNTHEISGKIAVLDRGNCAFIEKIRNSESAGAIAAIVVNDKEGNLFTMSGGADGDDIEIPSMLISLKNGNVLKKNIENLVVSLEASSTYDLSQHQENTIITLDTQNTQFMSREHVFQWISEEMKKLGFELPPEGIQERP